MKSVGNNFENVLVHQYIMFGLAVFFLQKIKNKQNTDTINIYVMFKNGCVIEIIFSNTQFCSLN